MLTYHFFANKKKISDDEVRKILVQALPKGKSREWYAALMDYGAHLKRSGVRLNAKAKGYVKQSAFKGSTREARGALLKELSKGSKTAKRLQGLLGDDRRVDIEKQLAALIREGMVLKTGPSYRLPF